MCAKNKRIFSIIIAFFLFFSGMCLENVQADFSLAYVINNADISHTISQEIEIVKSEVYIIEHPNIRNISYVRRIENRTMQNRRVMKRYMRIFSIQKELTGVSDFYIETREMRLPELVTSVTAAKKGNADIAIGNIVGSNILNILFVIGTSALIIPVPYAANFLIDGVIAVAAGVLLWVAVFRKMGSIEIVREDP